VTYSFSPQQRVYRTTITFDHFFSGAGSTTIYTSIPKFSSEAEAYITSSSVPSGSFGGGPLYFGAVVQARQASSGSEKVAANLSSYSGIGTSMRSTVGCTDRYFGSGIYLADFYIDNPNSRVAWVWTKAVSGTGSLDAYAHLLVKP
jgi:hypothetical protein